MALDAFKKLAAIFAEPTAVFAEGFACHEPDITGLGVGTDAAEGYGAAILDNGIGFGGGPNAVLKYGYWITP